MHPDADYPTLNMWLQTSHAASVPPAILIYFPRLFSLLLAEAAVL